MHLPSGIHLGISSQIEKLPRPTIEDNGYRWIEDALIPDEEFPASLTPMGQNLGAGAYGSVAIYTDPYGTEVAVKSAVTPDEERNLFNERGAYRALKEWAKNNPGDSSVAAMENVVKIYGMAEIPDGDGVKPVLLMEKVSGCDSIKMITELRWRLAHNEISITQFIGVMQFLGYQALQGTHMFRKADLLHWDLHPGNMMVDRETGNLKIIDFGMAEQLGYPRKTEGLGAYMSPEFSTKTGTVKKNQHDVFSIAASQFWGMEFDLATIRRHSNAQPDPQQMMLDSQEMKYRLPREGLKKPNQSLGQKSFYTDEVTGLPKRHPGYVDAKNGFKPAFFKAIQEMMSHSSRAPDSGAALDLDYFKGRLLSDDDARALLRDIAQSLSSVQEPGKKIRRAIPERPNLPRELAEPATVLDLLKHEHELESAARRRFGKRSPEMIVEMLKTCNRLLSKTCKTHYTFPASDDHAEETKNRELAENAYRALIQEVTNLRHDIEFMASSELPEVRDLLPGLPQELKQIAIEAGVLLRRQKMLEPTPSPAATPRFYRPIRQAQQRSRQLLETLKQRLLKNQAQKPEPTTGLMHYHIALSAQRRCHQLITLLESQAPQNSTPQDAATENLRNTLTALNNRFAEITNELIDADKDRQMPPQTSLALKQDEFEIRHLVQQAETLLDETPLPKTKSASAARRVQTMIDTLLKHDAHIKSLEARIGALLSEGPLDNMLDRLKESRANLDERLKQYDKSDALSFEGTKERINELVKEVFFGIRTYKGKARVGESVTEMDFEAAKEILERLRTDNLSPADREQASEDYHALAPRMDTFISRTRPLLEELGLPNGLGKIVENKEEEVLRNQYMPSSLRKLRSKLEENKKLNTPDGKVKECASIMEKVSLARDFLDWHFNANMKPVARRPSKAIPQHLLKSMAKPLPEKPLPEIKPLPDMPDEWVRSMQKSMTKPLPEKPLPEISEKPLPDIPDDMPDEWVRSMQKRMKKILQPENSTLGKIRHPLTTRRR